MQASTVLPPEVAAKNGVRYELGMVATGELQLDMSYQRQPRPGRIKNLIADYDPLAAGTLIVSARADGTLYVIDGQHRLLAARALQQPRAQLPAFVVYGLTPADEAMLFQYYNHNRVAVRAHERFHALLQQRDPIAMTVKAVVEASEFHLSTLSASGRGALMCYNELLDVVMRAERRYGAGTGAVLLTAALRIIQVAWDMEPPSQRGLVINTVAHFHAAFTWPPNPAYHWNEAARRFGRHLPVERLLSSVNMARLTTNGGTAARVGALGTLLQVLLDAYNYGRRDRNRLMLSLRNGAAQMQSEGVVTLE